MTDFLCAALVNFNYLEVNQLADFKNVAIIHEHSGQQLLELISRNAMTISMATPLWME